MVGMETWPTEHPVPKLMDAWYPLCLSRELRDKPVAAQLYGEPLVVFRDAEGLPRVLLDRCSHRNVPLSLGEVKQGELQCVYHGWRFNHDGRCVAIPGYTGACDRAARAVPTYPAREQDGIVWVFAKQGESMPEAQPAPFRFAGHPGYLTVLEALPAPAHLVAVAENALDVPHTAFLHRGLFRQDSKERSPVKVVVERYMDRVEVQYIGESKPPSIIGKLLAPKGGEVEHTDRFILPSRLEVEYRLGRAHFITEVALCPAGPFETLMFSAVSVRMPEALRPLLLPPLKRVALKIFAQDVEILRTQTEAAKRFGAEHYASSELDVILGPMRTLLQEAAETQSLAHEETSQLQSRREVTMML